MSVKQIQMTKGAVVALVLAGVAVAVTLFVVFAPYWSTHIWWFLRMQAFWVLPGLGVLVAAFLVYFVATNENGPATLAVLTLGGLAWFSWLFIYNYAQDAVYAETIQVTNDPAPAFAQRAPFSVSAAQVRSNLGDIPGDTQDTMYVPADETFATLVEQRGFATGYQTLLEQRISTGGRNVPTKCDFSDQAAARLGGWFAGNLGRRINTVQRWVNWSQDDAYGWCDPQGTPFVVVPLTEQQGVLVVTEKPAGFALYNGRTGELEIRTDAEGIPGPTYPLSLAAQQRESSGAINGFWDWLWGTSGWELPDEADSINSGNASEFVLAGSAGGEFYVTPESGRGSATAISALTVVDAELHGTDLAPLSVHQLGDEPHPVWQSATAITDRVRANFGDVFAQQRDSDIFELAPTGADTWVATIGTPQNLLYRVTGRGDLGEDPCLYALDDQQLRCGPTGNIGVATGGGATGTAPTVAPAAANSDLSTLTADQLADLVNRAAQELASRSSTEPTPPTR